MKVLAAIAMLGVLSLTATRLGAATQSDAGQASSSRASSDLRALEEEVARLRASQIAQEAINTDLRVKVALMEVRLTELDSGIGKKAVDYVIGGGDPNRTIAMQIGRSNLSSVALDRKTAIITAETIELRGKFIRIDATRTLTLNGETVDVTGGKVNVKGSSPIPLKGGKVLGN